MESLSVRSNFTWDIITKPKTKLDLDSCKLEYGKSEVRESDGIKIFNFRYELGHVTELDCDEGWRTGHMYAFLMK